MSRWFQSLTAALAVLAACVLSLIGLYWAERTMLPVVTDWTITGMRVVDDHVLVEGEFNKRRTCRLLKTSVALVRADGSHGRLLATIRPSDTEFGLDYPVGHSHWGPLEVAMPHYLAKAIEPGDRIQVSAVHQCHALWLQETTYGDFPAAKLIQLVKEAGK